MVARHESYTRRESRAIVGMRRTFVKQVRHALQSLVTKEARRLAGKATTREPDGSPTTFMKGKPEE